MTASNSTGFSRINVASVFWGLGSRFPSTISYSSRPSRIAAMESTESGKRRLPGLVALGL